jgi:hypothetical protein
MANNINGYELVPGADLHDANLAGIVFTGDLHGADLRGADLTGADLTGANLQDVNLRAADLTGARLGGANLQGANLQGASLRNAHLDGAILTSAILTGAILNGAIFQDAILNGRNLEIVQAAQARQAAPAAPAAIEGRAYEIHNYFDTLDMAEITRFLQEYNVRSADLNQRTMPSAAAASSEQSLFTPLLTFIDNSELFSPNEKEENKQKLNRILTIAQEYGRFNANRELLNSIIEFVSKQSDNFIEQYIRIISDECLNAYGQGGQSCVKGMFERIITILGTVAITLTQDGVSNQENETYKTLKKLFREINFSDYVQEWAVTYLEDGEKEEELKSLSTDERKRHFINFMTTKYGALINETIRRKILEEAEQYQQMGVFERMSFGGRRNKKTRRRKGNKKRKTMKKRKSIKKRKSMKRRNK